MHTRCTHSLGGPTEEADSAETLPSLNGEGMAEPIHNLIFLLGWGWEILGIYLIISECRGSELDKV